MPLANLIVVVVLALVVVVLLAAILRRPSRRKPDGMIHIIDRDGGYRAIGFYDPPEKRRRE